MYAQFTHSNNIPTKRTAAPQRCYHTVLYHYIDNASQLAAFTTWASYQSPISRSSKCSSIVLPSDYITLNKLHLGLPSGQLGKMWTPRRAKSVFFCLFLFIVITEHLYSVCLVGSPWEGFLEALLLWKGVPINDGPSLRLIANAVQWLLLFTLPGQANLKWWSFQRTSQLAVPGSKLTTQTTSYLWGNSSYVCF